MLPETTGRGLASESVCSADFVGPATPSQQAMETSGHRRADGDDDDDGSGGGGGSTGAEDMEPGGSEPAGARRASEPAAMA